MTAASASHAHDMGKLDANYTHIFNAARQPPPTSFNQVVRLIGKLCSRNAITAPSLVTKMAVESSSFSCREVANPPELVQPFNGLLTGFYIPPR